MYWIVEIFKRINADILLEDRDYALINVDHHMSNEQYGDINYVNTNALRQ